MAATMHNQDDNHQPLNRSGTGNTDPRWLRPVKIAVVVMTILIILGLGLLGYGFYKGVGRFSAEGTARQIFTYPPEARLIDADVNADGSMLLRFQINKGEDELIIIDPASKRILGQVSIKASEQFGFAE
jgi:hypothetical protein